MIIYYLIFKQQNQANSKNFTCFLFQYMSPVLILLELIIIKLELTYIKVDYYNNNKYKKVKILPQ